MIPFVLMIVGVILAVGSFIYIVTHPGGDKGQRGIFISHPRAVIGIVIGGLTFWTGAIWGIVLLVKIIVH